jgi:hypothetical protein
MKHAAPVRTEAEAQVRAVFKDGGVREAQLGEGDVERDPASWLGGLQPDSTSMAVLWGSTRRLGAVAGRSTGDEDVCYALPLGVERPRQARVASTALSSRRGCCDGAQQAAADSLLSRGGGAG